MPRFYIDPANIKEGVVLLSKEESRHAVLVLRLKPGDAVDLFDGSGLSFKGIITGTRNGTVSVALNAKADNARSLSMNVTLGVSVIKPGPMDLLIQKTSELGAATIAPLISDRTIVRFPKERWAAKTVRWQKIALESCKQCGRSQTAKIEAVQPFKLFCEAT